MNSREGTQFSPEWSPHLLKVLQVTLKYSQGWSSDMHMAVLGEQCHTAGKDTALSGAELPGFKSGSAPYWLCSLGLSLYVPEGQITEYPPHKMMARVN